MYPDCIFGYSYGELETNCFLIVLKLAYGYEIYIPPHGEYISRMKRGKPESRIGPFALWLHHHVYGDSVLFFKIYGFFSREDRQVFRDLMSVRGIGPKAAWTVMCVVPPDELRSMLGTKDPTFLIDSLPTGCGIGAATAKKIVAALHTKYLDHAGTGSRAHVPDEAKEAVIGCFQTMFGMTKTSAKKWIEKNRNDIDWSLPEEQLLAKVLSMKQ